MGFVQSLKRFDCFGFSRISSSKSKSDNSSLKEPLRQKQGVEIESKKSRWTGWNLFSCFRRESSQKRNGRYKLLERRESISEQHSELSPRERAGTHSILLSPTNLTALKKHSQKGRSFSFSERGFYAPKMSLEEKLSTVKTLKKRVDRNLRNNVLQKKLTTEELKKALVSLGGMTEDIKKELESIQTKLEKASGEGEKLLKKQERTLLKGALKEVHKAMEIKLALKKDPLFEKGTVSKELAQVLSGVSKGLQEKGGEFAQRCALTLALQDRLETYTDFYKETHTEKERASMKADVLESVLESKVFFPRQKTTLGTLVKDPLWKEMEELSSKERALVKRVLETGDSSVAAAFSKISEKKERNQDTAHLQQLDAPLNSEEIKEQQINALVQAQEEAEKLLDALLKEDSPDEELIQDVLHQQDENRALLNTLRATVTSDEKTIQELTSENRTQNETESKDSQESLELSDLEVAYKRLLETEEKLQGNSRLKPLPEMTTGNLSKDLFALLPGGGLVGLSDVLVKDKARRKEELAHKNPSSGDETEGFKSAKNFKELFEFLKYEKPEKSESAEEVQQSAPEIVNNKKEPQKPLPSLPKGKIRTHPPQKPLPPLPDSPQNQGKKENEKGLNFG